MRSTLTILCLLTSLPLAGAQAYDQLPAAPSPQPPATVTFSDSLEKANPQRNTASDTGASPEESAIATDPAVTLFPHSQTARYWISGQLNIIFQAHPPFHSPYEDTNSLHGAGEYKTSIVDTLNLGYQPHRNIHYNTDFLVDFEEAGGRGLSQALGLAGFTNLDVVRNPNLSTSPYLARG